MWPLLYNFGFSSYIYLFAGNIADLVQGDNWIRCCWSGVLSEEWIFVQFTVQLMPRAGAV